MTEREERDAQLEWLSSGRAGGPARIVKPQDAAAIRSLLAEAREMREALAGLVAAWDRAESNRGCYSCAEAHDCRCELDRKISDRCTCGRVELEAAAVRARRALAGEVSR